MVTETTQLPEGTDKIISGAAEGETLEAELIEPTPKEKAVAKLKEGRDTVASEAAGKARGFVGDGLTKSSDAVGNVAKLVGDTAAGLDDNLGTEYGDYARKAAGYLDDTAQKLATKDPDELIDDTRDFVRKSPGIALAGAAIVGFAIARLISSGLDAEKER